jgi:hypothetical protein
MGETKDTQSPLSTVRASSLRHVCLRFCLGYSFPWLDRPRSFDSQPQLDVIALLADGHHAPIVHASRGAGTGRSARIMSVPVGPGIAAGTRNRSAMRRGVSFGRDCRFRNTRNMAKSDERPSGKSSSTVGVSPSVVNIFEPTQDKSCERDPKPFVRSRPECRQRLTPGSPIQRTLFLATLRVQPFEKTVHVKNVCALTPHYGVVEEDLIGPWSWAEGSSFRLMSRVWSVDSAPGERNVDIDRAHSVELG